MLKDVKAFAIELGDAFSSGRYRGGWAPVITALRARRYDDREIEAIVRSKWTRWAADTVDGRRKATAADLLAFMDDKRQVKDLAASIKDLVNQTF